MSGSSTTVVLVVTFLYLGASLAIGILPGRRASQTTDGFVITSYSIHYTKLYDEGSARLDGVPTEPTVVGNQLSWSGLVIAGTEVRTVKLLLAVGAGVTEGEDANRAQVVNGATGSAMSGEASA